MITAKEVYPMLRLHQLIFLMRNAEAISAAIDTILKVDDHLEKHVIININDIEKGVFSTDNIISIKI